MPRCEICGDFVDRRKKLNPYSPAELAALDTYINVCGECYDDCMRKCRAVLGEARANDCKQTVCSPYYAAKFYAEAQKGREAEKLKSKQLRYQAMQPYLPNGSTSSWPRAPQTKPK